MFYQASLPGLHSATSLPGLACGTTALTKYCGENQGFGQDPVLRQPFSAAGKGAGFTDERHLWPAFFHLIDQCRPLTVFGEQVGSKDSLPWLDLVCADLEGIGYACGATNTPAAGFGAPQIRHRLYWVANSTNFGLHRGRSGKKSPNQKQLKRSCDVSGMGNTNSERLENVTPQGQTPGGTAGRTGASGGMTHAAGEQEYQKQQRPSPDERGRDAILLGRCSLANPGGRPGSTNGLWRAADWLFCWDGKWRAVVATHVTLADGPSSGMVRMCHESAIKKKEEISNERLCALRQGTGSETFFQWSSGVSIHVGAPEVLQQNMYGTTHEERDMFQSEPQQDEGGQDGGECLRDMWNDERSASSSCGQKSAKQCAIELEDVVSLLPCSLSLAKLYGDWRTEESLRLLQQAIYEAGALLYPSQPIQKVWASLSEEEKNSVRMGFDASRWKKLVSSPLECGATNRVGRLRGYGNAIVAPQAEAFIRAYMEITNYF